MPKQLTLILILTGLLNGCATESPLLKTDQQTEFPSYQDKANYNKPYTINGKTYYPLDSASGYREKGLASWYGSESGNRTASGSRFNPKVLSAAHKTLPIPSTVRVTNLRNGRQINVVVNDRGPVRNRLIDLSHGAAKQLGIHGLAEVEIEYLEN